MKKKNASNKIISNAKRTLRNICINNINRLIFRHLTMNLLRNKFYFLLNKLKDLLMFSCHLNKSWMTVCTWSIFD